MLQRIGAGDSVDTVDDRHLPVGPAGFADDAAHRAPFAEIGRGRSQSKAPGDAAAGIEMVAVARRPAAQCGGERRWSALEIAAGTEHAVRIDDDPGVAIGEMIAAD